MTPAPQFDISRWDAPALPQRWQLPPVLQRMLDDCHTRVALIEAQLLVPVEPPPVAVAGGLAAGLPADLLPPKDPTP